MVAKVLNKVAGNSHTSNVFFNNNPLNCWDPANDQFTSVKYIAFHLVFPAHAMIYFCSMYWSMGSRMNVLL